MDHLLDSVLFPVLPGDDERGVEIVRYDGEALDNIATLQRGHVLLRKPAEKHWPLLILVCCAYIVDQWGSAKFCSAYTENALKRSDRRPCSQLRSSWTVLHTNRCSYMLSIK